MKKQILIILFCGSVLHAATKRDSFVQMIDSNRLCRLESFMNAMHVDPEDKNPFIAHYQLYIGKLQSIKSKARKKNEMERVKRVATNAMEVKDAPLKSVIDSIHNGTYALKNSRDNVNKNINIFLTRYGSLQDYYQEQAKQTGSRWAKVKSFTKNMKTKMVNWFKSLKKSSDEPVAV